MNAFDALVQVAREQCTPDEFLNLNAFERDMLATLAASRYGTEALDHRDDPRLIRKVHAELLKPSVLLGLGTCECGDELDAEGRCPWRCFEDQPRANRTFAERYGRR